MQELFFCELISWRAVSRCLTVTIGLIQQVCLVTMYSEKKKNLFHPRDCDIKLKLHLQYQGMVLTVNQWLCLLELFPARQLNIMESVNSTVANGKQPIDVDSGSRFWLILQPLKNCH